MKSPATPTEARGRTAAVDLPWPCGDLSPNARLHWAVKARAVKQARSVAAWMATASRQFESLKGAKRLVAKVVFSPPDSRRRDTDNMLASIKPYFDGIVDVVGVDDSRWQIELCRGIPRKGGNVCIVLEAI